MEVSLSKSRTFSLLTCPITACNQQEAFWMVGKHRNSIWWERWGHVGESTGHITGFVWSTLQFTEYPQIRQPITCPITLWKWPGNCGTVFFIIFLLLLHRKGLWGPEVKCSAQHPWLSNGGWITKASLPPYRQVISKWESDACDPERNFFNYFFF